jgi:ferric-dicitrate binding protein FerR (iron transport regulator)
VRHSRGRLRLEPESGAERAVFGELPLEDLDGHLTPEGQVLPAYTVAHASAADEFIDAVPLGQHTRICRHFSPLG